MARFKEGNNSQSVMLPVSIVEQVMPGTFEFALTEAVEGLDLSVLEARIRNDETGAPAYAPRVMLKTVLFGYSRGLFSSRRIENACRTNVTFMVLAEFQQPDFTTIARFVSGLGDQAAAIFGQILEQCAGQNLIGGEMLAVDGCKISSNTAKEWSGTMKDLAHKKEKFAQRAKDLMDRHLESDRLEEQERLLKASEKMKKRADRIGAFLSEAQPKEGARGNEKQSNVTDNESAKMKSSHGMVQGYNGIVLVDARHQIIVQAEAFGTGHEHDIFVPVIEQGAANLARVGLREDLSGAVVLADNGYYKEANLKYIEEHNINGYIPDQEYRRRDARYATMDRHRGRLTDNTMYLHYQRRDGKGKFRIADFKYDPLEDSYSCPNGKTLVRRGKANVVSVRGHDYLTQRYGAKKADCGACSVRSQCLRKKETRSRTLNVILENQTPTVSCAEKMRQKMDTPEARHIYSHRMEIVEPVFANITVHKRLDYFTLRSKAKVDVQWKLYGIVHNIGKLANVANAAAQTA